MYSGQRLPLLSTDLIFPFWESLMIKASSFAFFYLLDLSFSNSSFDFLQAFIAENEECGVSGFG